MQTYQIDTVIKEEGILNIKGLPLHKGERVKVIVKSQQSKESDLQNPYPLRKQQIYYEEPFDSVAEHDWEANK